MAKSNEEIRKELSAPLSDDPVIRFRQKVERKAIILKKKGGPPKRKATVLEPKPKPKPKEEKKKEKQEGGFFEILKELRKKGNL